MKKIYLLTLAAFTLSLTVNAQIIEDDFEFYTLGDMGDQNPTVWSTTSGDPLDGTNFLVVDDITLDAQSGYIGPGLIQDALLVLGNQTSADYCLHFQIYITSGSTGYFNIQGETETNIITGYEGAGNGGAGVFNSSNLYFNEGGTSPGIFEDTTTGETGTYPEDAWVHVQIYFGVDALTYEISVDDVLVNQAPVPFQADATLGGINFFSIDANNNYWIDNVLFVNGFIDDIDDFATNNVKVYPNPVKDMLEIRSIESVDKISVYDVVGKLVLSNTPTVVSQNMDMSSLPSGIYLIQITIGDASKTVKVIK